MVGSGVGENTSYCHETGRFESGRRAPLTLGSLISRLGPINSFLCPTLLACEGFLFCLWPVPRTGLTAAAVFCELAPAKAILHPRWSLFSPPLLPSFPPPSSPPDNGKPLASSVSRRAKHKQRGMVLGGFKKNKKHTRKNPQNPSAVLCRVLPRLGEGEPEQPRAPTAGFGSRLGGQPASTLANGASPLHAASCPIMDAS